jgi:hypothetical protein
MFERLLYKIIAHEFMAPKFMANKKGTSTHSIARRMMQIPINGINPHP